MVKKIIALLTVLLLALNFNTSFFCLAYQTSSTSNNVYGRILNKSTYLYNSLATDNPCFLIPETYYVKIIKDEGDFCLVEYMYDESPYYSTITGYCKKNELYFGELIPDNPYCKLMIEIKPNTKAYLTKQLDKVDKIFTSGNPVTYYGKIKINSKDYYYVSIFGLEKYYIEASSCENFNIVLNSDPLPIPETPDVNLPVNNNTNKKPTEKNEIFQIILILVLAVPALLAIFFLFKPEKATKTQKKYFYEDNDNE